MALQVGAIVEGQGEYEAVRKIRERIWYEMLQGDYIDVLRPFRQPQGKLRQEGGLKAAVDAIKLGPESPGGPRKLVLILMDAEESCPRNLAPQILNWAREARSDADIACVLPYPMLETWFAAAGSSLAGVNGLPAGLMGAADPEAKGVGKAWVKKHLPRKDSETIDQPRFAAALDLALCRQDSPSFDKLCRELARRLPPTPKQETAKESGPGEE